jgi:putative tricarboxylic transport membrane protein
VTPIARLTGEYEAIVVPASSPIQTLRDLVAKLKADPGAVPGAAARPAAPTTSRPA